MTDASPRARLIQLVFLAALITIWTLIGRMHAISPLFLPPVGAVWSALRSLVVTDDFWSAVRVTLATVAEAYAIAVAVGLAAGYLVTRSRYLTRVFEPVLSGLFTIPITLFFPLFILLFGIGPGSKVAYGAAYGFFPIALNAIAGLAHADRRYVDAARAMGITRLGIVRHVLFPSAFAIILTGLRIGFFICFASVLGGETISSISGIGHNIALSAELMEPAGMYAWIVVVIAAALVLNASVSALENRIRGDAE
jgi:ABC-type nitrate/sulfonate/bicarbonate transport system permease component